MAQWNGEVRSVSFSYMSVLLQRDPEFFAKLRDEKLYEWSNGREFRGDPTEIATAYPRSEYPD